MGCTRFLANIDWDDVLAYNTLKIVRIRHKWLGGFYALTILAILVFIVGYYIIYSQEYNEYTIPTGVVQAAVSAPRDFISAAQLDYCAQNKSGAGISTGGDLPCVRWDTSLITLVQSSAVLLGTHIHESIFQLNSSACAADDYQQSTSSSDVCDVVLWEEVDGSATDLYISDVEHYTFTVEHAVAKKSNTNYNDPPDNMLVDMSMNEASAVSTNAGVPVKIQRENGGDVILLKDILKATGIDLNGAATGQAQAAASGPMYTQGLAQTNFRDTGITIISTIEYTLDGTSDMSFTYDLQYVPMSASFTQETRLNSTHKKVSVVNGVRLTFQIGGVFTQFSFKQLLITLVSGLALTASATTFTDLLTCHVLKNKEDYKLFKYETTPDFDPDDPIEKAVLEKVLNSKRKQNMLMYADEDDETDGGPNEANTAASIFVSNIAVPHI